MVVYLEYALIENFLLDGALLFLAMRVAEVNIRKRNLLLASLIGSLQAVAFPLVSLPKWAMIAVKLCGGGVVCVFAVHRGNRRSYLKTTVYFYALTAFAGGILTFFHSIIGGERISVWVEAVFLVSYTLGGAIIVSRIIRKRRLKACTVVCRLKQGNQTVRWSGLIDSGNLLRFRGEPVCVISPLGVFALFGAHPPCVGRMSLKTVTGEKEAPVFRCETLWVGECEWKNVYLTVGEMTGTFQIIVHTALTEGERNVSGVKEFLTKDDGRGKRRSLSLRK